MTDTTALHDLINPFPNSDFEIRGEREIKLAEVCEHYMLSVAMVKQQLEEFSQKYGPSTSINAFLDWIYRLEEKTNAIAARGE